MRLLTTLPLLTCAARQRRPTLSMGCPEEESFSSLNSYDKRGSAAVTRCE